MADDWALGRAWVAHQSNSLVPPVMEGNNRIWCHIFLQPRVCWKSIPLQTKLNSEAGLILCFLWWSHACRIITSSTIFPYFDMVMEGALKTFKNMGKSCQWRENVSPVFNIIPHIIFFFPIAIFLLMYLFFPSYVFYLFFVWGGFPNLPESHLKIPQTKRMSGVIT